MNTKELLLAKGLTLFSQASYEGVSVQFIVRSAGVSKPTLYHYFHSKLNFYEKIYDYVTRPLLQKVHETAKREGDFEEVLLATSAVVLDFALNNSEAYWFIENSLNLSPSGAHQQVVQQFWREFQGIFYAIFLRAELENANIRANAAFLSYSYLGAFRMLLQCLKLGRFQYNSHLLPGLIDGFLYGIYR